MAPGRCPRLELADIQSCRLRCLSDWCFTEPHEAAVFSQVGHVAAAARRSAGPRQPPCARVQVLQSAGDQFCCLDVFTGRLNSIAYVFCHDPTGPQRHSKEFWEVGLHTDVRFRSV